MKQLFLYGGVASNFEAVSRPFVAAAGSSSAKIALLMQGGSDWEKYVPRYKDPWMRNGAAEIIPIVPNRQLELDQETIARLASCSGVFVGGGDTRIYHQVYVRSEAGGLIRRLYQSGIPYGGVSAGALITPESCIISGSKVIEPDNEYLVRTVYFLDPYEDGDVQLRVGKGLGLLAECVVETHFSALGGFPRLVTAMEKTQTRLGLGLDESICLEIREGSFVKVHGQGRAYFARGIASHKYEVQIFEPGAKFEMH